MLHYVKSFTMQVVPSVAATIIGAYIVNHYIATPKTGSETPAVSIARHKAKPAPETRPAETSADVASLPEAGVKAKGISEKALLEKNAAAEKAAVEKPAEKDKPAEKAAEKTDKPAETASIPAEPRRQQAAPREKTAAIRVIPLTASQPATPAAPAVATPASAPAAEAAPEERRDANDLARAAIERLRGESAPRTQSAARAPETSKNEASRNEPSRNEPSRNEASRNPEGSRASEASTPQALRPLPPPIMVSAPPSDAADSATSQPRPPYANNARTDDPLRPTPPAEIPTARPPLDLRAEMAPREKPSVADEMLSAAKSMFQNVMPK